MNWRKTTLSLAMLMLLSSGQQTSAGMVTEQQARRIAANWLTMEIQSTGDWGGAEIASISDIVEFTRDDRVLGYYCSVEPSGFILVSLYEGLAPTKAYSETSELNLDPDDESTDVLRRQMESLLDIAEENLGSLTTVTKERLSDLVGYNHVSSWEMLDVSEAEFTTNLRVNKMPSDYHEGSALLTSCWNQNDPYNRLCPPATPDCDWDHCATGCAATAAAQIARYWSWPPEWDWMSMPDTLQATDPAAEINTTAQFNRTIADGLDLLFCNDGCATTYVPDNGADIEAFYQSWAYGDECTEAHRDDYNGYDWFLLFIEDLDRNRPLQYRMVGHFIVCDGYYWLPYPHYHMNWGHGGSKNAWYAVDTLPRPHPDWGLAWDYIVFRICPYGYLGPVVSGVYPHNPAYSWRYVDRDCQAASAHFAAGNLIEFLPYKKLECTSGFLRFEGNPALYTRLFSPQLSRGIRIEKGSIVAHPGGGIEFKVRRP